MSLEEKPEKKEKREPTLHGQISKTRRAYLRSIIEKKLILGIPLSDMEKGMKAAFDSVAAEE